MTELESSAWASTGVASARDVVDVESELWVAEPARGSGGWLESPRLSLMILRLPAFRTRVEGAQSHKPHALGFIVRLSFAFPLPLFALPLCIALASVARCGAFVARVALRRQAFSTDAERAADDAVL